MVRTSNALSCVLRAYLSLLDKDCQVLYLSNLLFSREKHPIELGSSSKALVRVSREADGQEPCSGRV